MVNVKINGIDISVKEGTTILDAAAELGIKIPTLCYLKDYNEIGACRMCVVDIKGFDHLQASCNTPCAEGMEIETDNERVRASRRTNLELLLSQHNVECTSCERNNNCELQRLSAIYTVGPKENPLKKQLPINEWDQDSPIIRDEDKCIRCYRCVSVCEQIQSVNIWDMVGSGEHTTVGVSGHRKFSESECVFCGQCVTHCPCNALHSRDIEDMHGLLYILPRLAIFMFIGIAGMFLAPFGMLISKWAALKASIDGARSLGLMPVSPQKSVWQQHYADLDLIMYSIPTLQPTLQLWRKAPSSLVVSRI